MSSPAKIHVAGALGDAHRFRAKVAGAYQLRVMAVHGGVAYVMYCETPDAPNAWLNVGSDCMIRGTTLHVAPPG